MGWADEAHGWDGQMKHMGGIRYISLIANYKTHKCFEHSLGI